MDTKHHIGIEKDGTRFKATIADLDIHVYGDTHQEAIQNAQKAIVSAHIQALKSAESAHARQGHVGVPTFFSPVFPAKPNGRKEP